MLAEAIVEQRAGVLAEGQHDPFTARGRRRLAGLDQRQALGLIAPATSEQDPSEDDRFVSGRLGDLVGLVEQRRRRGQLALEAAHQREQVEG